MNNLINSWANEVIEQVTPLAVNLKLDFYPLQSPINLNPEVLFLGLNPGGGATYDIQSNNEKWDFVDGHDEMGNAMKVMTPERLLAGNPYFDINSNDWKYLKGLRRIPVFDKALSDKDFLLANYYYMSTPDFKETQSHAKEIEICKDLTFRLIDIINPKLIVVLGTSQGIDKLKDFQNKETIIRGHHQRLLVSASYNNNNGNIPVLAIPHPSTMAITHEEASAINTNLEEILQGKPLTIFDEFKKVDINRFSIDQFIEKLTSKNIPATFTNENNKYYDWVIKGKEDDLLIRLDIKGKYFAIRDSKAKGSRPLDRFYSNLKNVDHYIEAFSKPNLDKTNSWMLQKYFQGYEFDSLETLYDKMTDEFAALYNRVVG